MSERNGDTPLIEYETTLDDLVAFNVFHLKSSRAGRVTRLRGTLSVVAFGLLLGVAGAALTRNAVHLVVGVGLGGLGAVLFQPILVRSTRENARRFYADGANRGLVGRHRLTLERDGLREENEIGSQETAYPAIERVEETDDSAYVYVGAIQAHVVARARLKSGNLEGFVQELRARLEH